ncbi:MAG: PHP domain-containing protein [Methanomassiliicoccales archaeon]|nr:PHP domain-containing protein [Methanomassiliicoccales archaeon]
MASRTAFLFHVHTNRSVDSIMSIETVMNFCRRRGINLVALCEHNYLMPAEQREQLEKKYKLRIIPAIEYATDCGDIIALGIEEVRKSRDCAELIDFVKEKGGLVVLPHPMRGHKLDRIPMDRVDMIEVFNGRCSDVENNAAIKLAEDYKKIGIAGCDAHFPWELGLALNEIRIEIGGDVALDSILSSIRIIHQKRGYPEINTFMSQLVKLVKTRFRSF